MRPKEWLVQNGHLPQGSEKRRGRISLEHKALLAASGIDFTSVSTARPVRAQASGDVAPKTTAGKPAVTYTTPEPTAGPDIVFKDEYGRVVSPAEVCANCNRSLSWCWCRAFSWAINSRHTQGQVRRYSKTTGREVSLASMM